MDGITSVPRPAFGPSGFIAPAESDVLAGVGTDINTAFGGNLNLALSTPQGQLASSLAAIIGDSNDQFVLYTNQVDPSYASGRMQDGIARIYFLTRNPAQSTVVQALCTGLANTLIPVGALARATDGTLYACTLAGSIGAGGNVTLPFAALTTGPIVCGPGALSAVYRLIPGWDSITNAAPGVIGNVVETRAAFEFRRNLSVAVNARGTLPSIQGAVLAVPNVLDAFVTDNVTNAPTLVGGVSLAAHTLYVAVAGGDPQAVAAAIWSKKPPGCGYTGNTTMTVLDAFSGYTAPLPSYSVTFQTAAPTPVLFAVSITAAANVPANALALISTAIALAMAGADNGPRARIGSLLYASRFYAGIAALGPWAMEIVSVLIGIATPTGTTAQMQIDQVPTVGTITLALV